MSDEPTSTSTNPPSKTYIDKLAVLPSELPQLLDADNQTVMETRENRGYPWFKEFNFLLALLCAFLLIGILTAAAFQSWQQKLEISMNELQQKIDNSLKIYQDAQSNSRDKNELQQNFDNSMNKLQQKFDNSMNKLQQKFYNSMNELQQKLDISTNELQQKFDHFLKIYQNAQSNSRDKILFYLHYGNNDVDEGRICLFDSHTNSVEQIAKFTNSLRSDEVTTTKDKIFGIRSPKKSFEIFDSDTRRTSRGPDPPGWRVFASVAYFKDKLYYLGGEDPKTGEDTNRVDVLIDGKWQTGPAFPFPITDVQTITCDEILYVIDGCERYGSRKIYRLSNDEREWIEVEEVPERRILFRVASLNGKIYITGGRYGGTVTLKSCLCFDSSAPVDSRISRIADMNYARHHHSLVAANGKLYAIGGFQKAERRDGGYYPINFCDVIEEYNPQTNKWREVGKITIK